MKPILARKSKEREGMCMHPLVQGMVSAGARTHPLANSFIETKFPIAFHFLVLPLAPFLELILKLIILELFRWNSEKFRLLLVVTLHMEKLFF